MVHRHVDTNLDLSTPASHDQSVCVIYTGCDQCIVSANSFLITSRSGSFYHVYGSLQGMGTSSALEIVNAATLVTLKSGDKVILSWICLLVVFW